MGDSGRKKKTRKRRCSKKRLKKKMICHKGTKKKLKKPANLKEMISISRRLSKHFEGFIREQKGNLKNYAN